MSIYTVIAGDTFDSVSRKVYGTQEHGGLIFSANPGVLEPLQAGDALTIPPLPLVGGPEVPTAPAPTSTAAVAVAPVAQLQGAPQSQDEVAILIDGQRFRGWESVTITRSLDSFDSVELSAPFDPTDPIHRAVFRPFSFKSVAVYVGTELLFAGTMVPVIPRRQPSRSSVQVGCYSRPGVLSDCTPPASAAGAEETPLEFNNLTLAEIAGRLAAPFGVAVAVAGDVGAAFDRVACRPTSRVAAFLADLARQRNLLLSNTVDGALLLRQPRDGGEPVARLREGAPPLTEVTPQFSPQSYYSHVSGLEPVTLGTAGGAETVRNPHLDGVVRPFSFTVKDAVGGDVPAAVAAKAGHMFGNMVSYQASVAGWRDAGGALWSPDTTVTLQAPGAMVYRDYELLVRSVRLTATASRKSASLGLVLPGAFRGEIPETLPWDD